MGKMIPFPDDEKRLELIIGYIDDYEKQEVKKEVIYSPL